jgi:hypothetical protein
VSLYTVDLLTLFSDPVIFCKLGIKSKEKLGKVNDKDGIKRR